MAGDATDAIVTFGPVFYGPSLRWPASALGCALLLLAFVFRRKVWVRRALLTLAGLCFVVAWVL